MKKQEMTDYFINGAEINVVENNAINTFYLDNYKEDFGWSSYQGRN